MLLLLMLYIKHIFFQFQVMADSSKKTWLSCQVYQSPKKQMSIWHGWFFTHWWLH